MDEYIKRETIIERLEKNLVASNPGSWGELCYHDAINSVKGIPAADVAPVRHGWWVNTHSDSEFVQCCLCKYPVYAAWNVTNYCPNCGAKMDGGTE